MHTLNHYSGSSKNLVGIENTAHNIQLTVNWITWKLREVLVFTYGNLLNQ